jgi:multidrug efflux pump subunit AcrA (membrane-fusion protein)
MTAEAISETPSAAVPLVAQDFHARRWLVRGAVLALVLAVVATAAGLLSAARSPQKAAPKLTHKIARQDLNVKVTEEGTLESANNVEIRCRVRGANNTIVSIIENGTEVKPGDLLVRIDTKTIEDNINTQEIAYQNALATFAQSDSDVAIAKINITEYLEGTYRSELKTKEKDVAIAKANLAHAENMVKHSDRMFRKGYIGQLEVQSNGYALQQAQLELEVKETDLDVLNRYSKAKKLQELDGILKAKEAKLASDKAAVALEKSKLDRERQQLEYCVIKAQRGGMVVYAGSQQWENKPDIREGATVREDQILLLMPDLDNMQVKVGIHEAKVDQVKPSMPAKVQVQDRVLDGEVLSLAAVAKPAGWWNGNMVKYDAVIKIKPTSGLKPGMSANVEVFLARHKNVVAVPVAAVAEQQGKYFCWVKSGNGTQRRELKIGDTDDQFIIVQAGVKEGDEAVINPLAYVEEAQKEALKPMSGIKSDETEAQGPEGKKPKRETKAEEKAKPGQAEPAETGASKPQGQAKE